MFPVQSSDHITSIRTFPFLASKGHLVPDLRRTRQVPLEILEQRSGSWLFASTATAAPLVSTATRFQEQKTVIASALAWTRFGRRGHHGIS